MVAAHLPALFACHCSCCSASSDSPSTELKFLLINDGGLRVFYATGILSLNLVQLDILLCTFTPLTLRLQHLKFIGSLGAKQIGTSSNSDTHASSNVGFLPDSFSSMCSGLITKNVAPFSSISPLCTWSFAFLVSDESANRNLNCPCTSSGPEEHHDQLPRCLTRNRIYIKTASGAHRDRHGLMTRTCGNLIYERIALPLARVGTDIAP